MSALPTAADLGCLASGPFLFLTTASANELRLPCAPTEKCWRVLLGCLGAQLRRALHGCEHLAGRQFLVWPKCNFALLPNVWQAPMHACAGCHAVRRARSRAAVLRDVGAHGAWGRAEPCCCIVLRVLEQSGELCCAAKGTPLRTVKRMAQSVLWRLHAEVTSLTPAALPTFPGHLPAGGLWTAGGARWRCGPAPAAPQ